MAEPFSIEELLKAYEARAKKEAALEAKALTLRELEIDHKVTAKQLELEETKRKLEAVQNGGGAAEPMPAPDSTQEPPAVGTWSDFEFPKPVRPRGAEGGGQAPPVPGDAPPFSDLAMMGAMEMPAEAGPRLEGIRGSTEALEAILADGGATAGYRAGDVLPSGWKVMAVEATKAVLRRPDGEDVTLSLR